MSSRLLAAAALLAAIGCGRGPGRAAPVEPEKARAALAAALDAWKAGRPIDSLRQESPPIVAQDFDWMAGAKLVSYELVGDGKPEDANLRIQVRLTVQGAQGKAAPKTVTYVVGTDPALTVFRALE